MVTSDAFWLLVVCAARSVLANFVEDGAPKNVERISNHPA